MQCDTADKWLERIGDQRGWWSGRPTVRQQANDHKERLVRSLRGAARWQQEACRWCGACRVRTSGRRVRTGVLDLCVVPTVKAWTQHLRVAYLTPTPTHPFGKVSAMVGSYLGYDAIRVTWMTTV